MTFLVIPTLWLLSFAVASQFLLLAPVLPRIAEATGESQELLGFLMSAYAVTLGVVSLVSGPISDALGRRALIRAGAVVMSLALFAHWFARDFHSLLAVRVAAGIAGGILSGAPVSYLGDLVPYERRGRAMGWVMSAMAVGQILGIPAGAFLAARMGYQAPFMVFGAICAVAAGLSFLLPAAPAAERPGGGYVALLKRGDVLAACGAMTAMMLSVSLFVIFQPMWMEQHFQVDGEETSRVFLAAGLGNAIAGPIAGWVSDKVGRKVLVVGASVALAAAMLVVPQLPSFILIFPAMFITMAAAATRIGPLNALLSAMADASERGTLLNLAVAAGQVGFALGSAVAGPLFTRHGYTLTAGVAAAFCLVAAGIVGFGVPEPQGKA